MPYGANGMDHESRRQAIPSCQLGVPGVAAAEPTALFEQFRSRGPVNRPVDAPSAQERRISRVYNRVNSERRDVCTEGSNGHAHRYFCRIAAPSSVVNMITASPFSPM